MKQRVIFGVFLVALTVMANLAVPAFAQGPQNEGSPASEETSTACQADDMQSMMGAVGDAQGTDHASCGGGSDGGMMAGTGADHMSGGGMMGGQGRMM